MGKENLANGQGRFYFEKNNPLYDDSQIMVDLQTAAKRCLDSSLTNDTASDFTPWCELAEQAHAICAQGMIMQK